MRKNIYYIKLLLLSSFLFLYSCKKNNDAVNLPNALVSELAIKVTNWLENQKSITTVPANKPKIQSLLGSLDLANLSTEELNEGEKLVIVPVKSSFHSDFNKDKATIINLLLVLNKTGELRKGNIVQFIPANGNDTKLPMNTFNKMYNFRKLEVDGKFSFLNIADRLLYEYGYKDGKLFSSGVVQINQLPSGRSQRTTQCTDWYLVTTYYYEDGTTSQTKEYVGTSCDGNCGDPMNQSFCQVGEVGGGDGSVEEEQIISKPKSWVVKTDPNSFWEIYSEETFSGRSGHFTNVVHKRSWALGYYGYNCSWGEGICDRGYSGSMAWSTVQGSLKNTDTGDSFPESGYGSFAYNQVF